VPQMVIRVEGQGGAFADVLHQYRRITEMPHDVPIRVETLDHGMESGAPSVAFIIELPELRRCIVAETSLKLFQLAAAATFARYGDMTGGSFMGVLEKGSFRLNLSAPVDCPACKQTVPGSCKFCPHCGAALEKSA